MKLKLEHGVKAKFRRTDPLNPNELTLSDMRKHPYRLWLKYIEPNIVAMGTSPDDCWCWDIKNREHDPSRWVPQVHATMSPDVEHPALRRWNARRFIMQLFYEFPDIYVIYRNKHICSCYNCVRPSHLIAAPQGNKDAKYG